MGTNKLKDFSETAIELYSHYNKIDKNIAYSLFKDVYKYYSGKKEERIKTNPLLPLEDRWYRALDTGVVDYSVYGDNYYFTDLIACYWIYSKEYIKNLNKKVFDNKTKTITERFNGISSIIDLGCGLGYTTSDLSELFPTAKVYGTNIKDTPQWFHCLEVCEGKATLLSEYDLPNQHIDMVFASEFFEHIETPIELLHTIINKLTPTVLIIANSFNTKSIGHFYEYKHNGVTIPQKNISKEFNKTLREIGYVKEKTSLWNNKPSVWVKKENL